MFKGENSRLQAGGRFEETVNKTNFLERLPQLRKRAFHPRIIRDSFRDTGLVPFNPQKVLDQIPQPEEEPPLIVTEGPLSNQPSTPRQETPQQDSSPIPSSPITTPQSVGRVIRKIQDKDISSDPKIIKGFELICDGLRRSAERNRYLEQSLRNHLIPAKKPSKRRVLNQSTGRLYPNDAHSSIKQRRDQEQATKDRKMEKMNRNQLLLIDVFASQPPPIAPNPPLSEAGPSTSAYDRIMEVIRPRDKGKQPIRGEEGG